MGGPGSGRREYARTPIVGRRHTLDVNDFTDAVTHPGATIPYRWRDDYGTGEEVASLGIFVERDGAPAFDGEDRAAVADALAERATHLRLKATVTPPDGESKDLDYVVPLEYTPCNFGGVRPWFRCPAKGCGDRVGKLYRPPRAEVFACRECYALGYQTSRTSGDEMKQAELRYRRAYAKIDADGRRPHPNDYGPIPPERPTGMHGSTYAELAADLEDAYREWQAASERRLRALVDRSNKVLDDLADYAP